MPGPDTLLPMRRKPVRIADQAPQIFLATEPLDRWLHASPDRSRERNVGKDRRPLGLLRALATNDRRTPVLFRFRSSVRYRLRFGAPYSLGLTKVLHIHVPKCGYPVVRKSIVR